MMFIVGPGETILTIVRKRWEWWKDKQVGFHSIWRMCVLSLLWFVCFAFPRDFLLRNINLWGKKWINEDRWIRKCKKGQGRKSWKQGYPITIFFVDTKKIWLTTSSNGWVKKRYAAYSEYNWHQTYKCRNYVQQMMGLPLNH